MTTSSPEQRVVDGRCRASSRPTASLRPRTARRLLHHLLGHGRCQGPSWRTEGRRRHFLRYVTNHAFSGLPVTSYGAVSSARLRLRRGATRGAARFSAAWPPPRGRRSSRRRGRPVRSRTDARGGRRSDPRPRAPTGRGPRPGRRRRLRTPQGRSAVAGGGASRTQDHEKI